ncbi:ABC transporter ATP-binding protein [Pollutimonas nitritireducens]|uniref:ABC transporter ATP-binding protein n=1 Tax=Pollutimonas nitritireducens TaxID=2045209 RepID=A0A2N4UB68_9BURK|nr:ABC transporter ATP-binding protein [Pollutimonas nitritireducens]PLC52266.1 ABC transporter ATP-binding protein [Pollutimonas nitritireducens]
MSDPILQVVDLKVHYGASQVLFGVNFELQRGQCLTLLGRNGAGKSTTMKAIAGVHPATNGQIIFNGRNIVKDKSYRIARDGLGFVPEDRQAFPEHTVEENLLVAEKLGVNGQADWTLQRVYDTFPLLTPLKQREAGLLSGGEQQMLVIARALMGNPSVLLLDEPSEGLAPVIVQQIARCVTGLLNAGATILMAEQNMHFCLHISTHVAVIDKGSIVFTGTTQDLRDNEDVTAKYLSV